MAGSVNEKIMQSVRQAKSKLDKMKRDFDYSAGETDLKTRRRFDISELGTALSIAQKAAEDTNKIIKEREVTVHTLDITCRALLPQEPTIDSIAAVYNIIKELNEFEIDFAISATLNRSEVASGSKELDASLTAKMIEAFWESTFTNHPDYDDYMRRTREKKAQEKKQQDDAKAQSKKKTNDQKSVIARAQQQQQAFVQQGEDLKQAYRESLEKAMQVIREKARASIGQAVAALESEAASERSTLASLGFFAFSKKKECQARIDGLEARIARMKTEDYFDQQLTPYQTAMDAAQKKYADAIANHVRKAFTEKEHPNYEQEEKIRNLQPIEDLHWSKQGDMLVAQNVESALYGNEKGMTEEELRNDWCLYDYPGSAYSILSKLSRSGHIQRVQVNGEQRYFHNRARILSTIKIPVLNPQFQNAPWPTPTDAGEILKWDKE